MRFSMLYSGEQILSFKSCLVFYAGDSLNKFYYESLLTLARILNVLGDRWELLPSVHTYIRNAISSSSIHTLTGEPSALNKTVHVFLHTRTQQLRVFPDEKYAGGGRGEGLKANHFNFVVGGGTVFFPFFPAMMNKQNIGTREKLSPCEYTVLYPGKTRLKPRLFLPAILAGN